MQNIFCIQHQVFPLTSARLSPDFYNILEYVKKCKNVMSVIRCKALIYHQKGKQRLNIC